MKNLTSIILLLLLTLIPNILFAQKKLDALTAKEKLVYAEHMKFGQPDQNKVLVRTAFVTSYNNEYRIPNYSVYHIKSDYLNTPKRKSRFSRFRTDPDIENAVNNAEYDGLYSEYNYARGHYCPYKVLGGDRFGDVKYANYDKNKSDPDDEKTVYEGNYLSNIAPQLHYGLNGSGGVWFKSERWVQDKVVSTENEVWVYSGGIVLDNRKPETVGKNNTIYVPDLFYKVVVTESNTDFPNVIVFLFPHYDNKKDYVEKDIFKYTVSIDYLEVITGFDFFNHYPTNIQKENERLSYNQEYWSQY